MRTCDMLCTYCQRENFGEPLHGRDGAISNLVGTVAVIGWGTSRRCACVVSWRCFRLTEYREHQSAQHGRGLRVFGRVDSKCKFADKLIKVHSAFNNSRSFTLLSMCDAHYVRLSMIIHCLLIIFCHEWKSVQLL